MVRPSDEKAGVEGEVVLLKFEDTLEGLKQPCGEWREATKETEGWQAAGQSWRPLLRVVPISTVVCFSSSAWAQVQKMGAGAWIQDWGTEEGYDQGSRAGEMEVLEYEDMVEIMVFKLKLTMEVREDRRGLRRERGEGHVC